MDLKRKAGRWAGRRVARRMAKSIPFVGVAISGALLAEAVKRKGWVGGVVDTGLDAIPFFGALKNGIELLTDDWIPDRPAGKTPPGDARGSGASSTPTSRRRS